MHRHSKINPKTNNNQPWNCKSTTYVKNLPTCFCYYVNVKPFQLLFNWSYKLQKYSKQQNLFFSFTYELTKESFWMPNVFGFITEETIWICNAWKKNWMLNITVQLLWSGMSLSTEIWANQWNKSPANTHTIPFTSKNKNNLPIEQTLQF